MLSFFGDGPGKTPPTPTVVVSRTIQKSAHPSHPTQNGSSSRNGSHTPSTASPKLGVASTSGPHPSRPSSASSHHSIHKSSPNHNGTSRPSSLTPRPAGIEVKKPSSSSSASRLKTGDRPRSRLGSTDSFSSAQRKGKSATPVPATNVGPRSPSQSSSSSEDAFEEPKRKRAKNGAVNGASDNDVDRGPQWCLNLVDERGEWNRGWTGFVPSEEVVRGQRRGWARSIPSKDDLGKYIPFFPQTGFEKTEPLPMVELLYPSGCKEGFPLLVPANRREYAPLDELRDALKHIFEYYIPPSHQAKFGNLPNALDFIDKPPTPASQLNSPNPDRLATPDESETPVPETNAVPSETIADAVRKSLARNRKDGPAFLRAMNRYNTAMAELIADGSISTWMETRPKLTGEEWSNLVDKVHEQAYARVVGPYSEQLEHHPKHTDEVSRAIIDIEDSYGELRHRFMSKVIEQTKMGPESVFVDLGSGVGNCVLQAALQPGARSYGFELLPIPAHCARLQVRETQRRWSIWGLKGNLDVEVHEGDFRTHPDVGKRLREADVVLVNNEVFPASLNVELTNMFLDLKDGAVIVSLKPFVPESFKMTATNCDSFAAIVRMTEHTYFSGWVSWKFDSGTYYVQVIDRSMRKKFEEQMNGRVRRS